MTTVHVARIERRIPRGPVPDRFPTHVMVLADEARRPGAADLAARPGQSPVRRRPLRAGRGRADRPAAARDRDSGERGQSRRARPRGDRGADRARHPGRPEHVIARLHDGLAAAITSGAPIRVADAVMDRLAGPAGTGQDGPMPERTARDLSSDLRPRYEPRNLTFAAGL